ncbi:MAG: polynucleotide adenylyltransferase PcnB [Woeseiaceae bacterium]|nr:polynucleotide adenylyltransferase PcnB [Woeseiaceae bacterium]
MKNSGSHQQAEPQIIPRSSHNVSRAEISKNALKVLYRLNKAGFQAFLVGGGVRDALLELHPKDFDIATDAHPDEIKALFGNCRLIGRRFRLAHVRFGREVIEVATFRASAGDEDGHPDAELDAEGRIVRDNVYGTIDEDVWRRDFTCNALYYNIADFSIWDYTGGVEDIRNRRLVLIGDADTRLREDPVRMLRAIRFAAKLDFTIDASVENAMRGASGLLRNVPPARLFDEFLKMFQAGHAHKTFDLLRRHGLFRQLFPETDEYLDKDASFLRFVEAALVNTDRRVTSGKSVTPMFLIGVFLWAPVRERARQLREEENMSMPQSLNAAGWDITGLQQSRISMPKRFTAPMREMLALQPRFEQRTGRRGQRLLEHRRFRAAYDFLVLRAEVGEVDESLATFWTEVQTQSADERDRSFGIGGADKGDKPRRKRRRRGGRRRSPESESS